MKGDYGGGGWEGQRYMWLCEVVKASKYEYIDDWRGRRNIFPVAVP